MLATPAALSPLLCHLSAPLTRLDLMPCMHGRLRAAASEHVQLLLSRLSQFTSLQRLELHCPEDAGGNTIQSTVQLHVPPAIAVQRHLQHLRLTACITTVSQTLQGLALQVTQGRTSLTSLVLECRMSGSEVEQAEAWRPCVPRLSHLHLQHLDLHLMSSTTRYGCSMRLLLEHLTALTALRVRGWDCLGSPGAPDALAAMPRLRKLHLLGMGVPAPLISPCASALLALSGLTNLVVSIRGRAPNAAFSEALAAAAPAKPWPDLQHLGLKATLENGNSDTVIELACKLQSPARPVLELRLAYPQHDEIDDDLPYYQVKDAAVRYAKVAANKAAVSLSFIEEFFHPFPF